jgi:meso-butanediol dehydrogenase/(S,S)-butanediol dehydrogenase/diacetyl reductase
MRILDGRVALVTGAGQGSGRGAALALAAEGASVAVVGRTESKLLDVAKEIRERGSAAISVPCDVGDIAQIDAAIETTVSEFGTVDILVQAAQHLARVGDLLDMPDEDIELLWTTGPRATLRFMRKCHPYLRGGGSIINFGSSTQIKPHHFGVYAATKDAIRALTRAAAVEWGPDQIRVNMLAPVTDSPNWIADRARRNDNSPPGLGVPLGRVGDAERDIGRVVVFLAGEDSAYLTGQFLLADGGFAYHR